MNNLRFGFFVFGLACCTNAGQLSSVISLARSAQKSDEKTPPEPKEPVRDASGEPLRKLPLQVKAAKGKLTLFADYKNKTDKGVPLYFVNRTGKALILEHQDGDLYFKLEYESAPDQWTRAEPHQFSWCGNSYYPRRRIADESFSMCYGYSPTSGAKVKVRYASYRQSFQLVSNVTTGFVLKNDIRKAGNDALAVYSGSFDFVSKVARGDIRLTNKMDHIRDLRYVAIGQLRTSRFPRAPAIKVLQAIAEGPDQKYAKEAMYVLRLMKDKE